MPNNQTDQTLPLKGESESGWVRWSVCSGPNRDDGARAQLLPVANIPDLDWLGQVRGDARAWFAEAQGLSRAPKPPKDGSPDGNEHPPPDSNIETSMTYETRPLANVANSTGIQAEIEEKFE